MLYVIDGLDGSGKETQANLLTQRLKSDGYDAKIISFPVYESESSSLVRYIKSGGLKRGLSDSNPYGICSAFSLDRFITFENNPELKEYARAKDKVLIADRYTTSNLIYQGARFLSNSDEFKSFYNWCTEYEYTLLDIPKPDMVYFLFLEKRIRDMLLRKRYKGDIPYDVYENDKNLQDLAGKTAIKLIELGGWNYFNCENNDGAGIKTIDEINAELYDKVRMHMKMNGDFK